MERKHMSTQLHIIHRAAYDLILRPYRGPGLTIR
jgi:hypothetical protein